MCFKRLHDFQFFRHQSGWDRGLKSRLQILCVILTRCYFNCTANEHVLFHFHFRSFVIQRQKTFLIISYVLIAETFNISKWILMLSCFSHGSFYRNESQPFQMKQHQIVGSLHWDFLRYIFFYSTFNKWFILRRNWIYFVLTALCNIYCNHKSQLF